MTKMMSHLGIEIPKYNRSKDPIFHHAIRLQPNELTTTSNPFLEEPPTVNDLKEEDEKPDIEVKTEKDEDCVAQITLAEPMTAYPAPFFTALPFLSMGLPFPPMFVYPQLAPLFYFPLIQAPAAHILESPKPTPACSYCMDSEDSLVCLYYHAKDGNSSSEITDDEKYDGTMLEQNAENETSSGDNPADKIAKNPGWFGKGFRKGLKKKR